MQKVTISAQLREKNENPKNLFKEGLLTAVAYDSKGDVRNLKINDTRITNILSSITYSTIVELKIGDNKPELAFVTEVQRDKRTNNPYHLSFFVLDPNKVTKIHVNLEVTGESPAVKNNIGVLLSTLDSIEIKGKPDAIPESIEIDISSLNEIGDTIFMRDIKLPAGVELVRKDDEKLTVMTIRPFQEIVEEEKPEEAEEVAEGEAPAEGEEGAAEGEKPAEGTEGEKPAEPEKGKEEAAPQKSDNK